MKFKKALKTWVHRTDSQLHALCIMENKDKTYTVRYIFGNCANQTEGDESREVMTFSSAQLAEAFMANMEILILDTIKS